MHQTWLAVVNTAHGRSTLHGRLARVAARAAVEAASACDIELLAVAVVDTGLRAVIRAPQSKDVRRFIRMFESRVVVQAGARPPHFARAVHISRIRAQDLSDRIRRIRRSWQNLAVEEKQMSKRTKPGSKSAVRTACRLLPRIERSNEALLGINELATRIRRYVAAHDSPADDREAFARLCGFIMTHRVGFAAVETHREELCVAFEDFVPAAVAELDTAAIAGRLASPVLRDATKISTCVRCARGWRDASREGPYLGRLARVAALDDAPAGWPGLVSTVSADFPEIAPLARALLKRWGFFTALEHAGVRRLLGRLELIDGEGAACAAQLLVSAVAQERGCDPYAIEATLAIFAGIGPCRRQPSCSDCPAFERCPAAAQFDKTGREPPPAAMVS